MARNDNSATTSRVLVMASVMMVVAALYLAQEVLVPLALAILLTFLLTPLVRVFERWRFNRGLAVAVTVAIAFGILGGIGYIVYNQMDDLAAHFNDYKANIQAKVRSVRTGGGFLSNVKQAGHDVQQILAEPASQPTSQPTTATAGTDGSNRGEANTSRGIDDNNKTADENDKPPPKVFVVNQPAPVGASGSSPFGLFEDISGKILGPVGTAFIVVVFTIFMLLQREDLRDRLIRLVGRSRLTVTTEAMDDAAERVSRYLLMQSIINGGVGVAVMSLLWGVGKFNGKPFPSPALFGLLVALLRFIPYIGVWVAASMPLLLSLAVYESARVGIEVIGGFLAIELIAANALEPLLFGSSTGLTTLAVLVAAAFWTWLWGPLGLLLSTPMTVCVVVIGKYVPGLSFLNILLADEPPLPPHDRVYQRLLAADEEEAESLVDEYAKKMPLEELYDTVLVPALVMAERDRHAGTLEEDRHNVIRKGMRELVEELGDRQHTEQARLDAQAVVDKAKGDKPAGEGNGQAKPGETAYVPAIAQPAPGVRVALPQGCTINVTCLPARDESDEIAAMMFAQLLELRGYCVAVVSYERLASEMVDAVQRVNANVVCISALPPGAVQHGRSLCKRLRVKLPDARMLIGLWTTRGDVKNAKERMGCGEAELAGSFTEALDRVHQVVQPILAAAGDRAATTAAPPPMAASGQSRI